MADVLDSQLTPGIGTSETDVCVPSAAGAVRTIIGLSVSNTTTAPIKVTVRKKRGATTVSLVTNAPVPVGGSLIVIGAEQKSVVKQSSADKITVQSDTAASCDVDCNYLEQTP